MTTQPEPTRVYDAEWYRPPLDLPTGERLTILEDYRQRGVTTLAAEIDWLLDTARAEFDRAEQATKECERLEAKVKELARIVKADERGAARAHQLVADLKDCLLSVVIDTSGSQPCWCLAPLQQGQHGEQCQRIRATLLRLVPTVASVAGTGEGA